MKTYVLLLLLALVSKVFSGVINFEYDQEKQNQIITSTKEPPKAKTTKTPPGNLYQITSSSRQPITSTSTKEPPKAKTTKAPPRNQHQISSSPSATSEIITATSEVEIISTVSPTSTKAPKSIPYTTTCSTEEGYATITTSLSGSPTDVPVYTIVPKLYEHCIKYTNMCKNMQTFYDFITTEVATYSPVTCPDIELTQDIVAIADPDQENIYIPKRGSTLNPSTKGANHTEFHIYENTLYCFEKQYTTNKSGASIKNDCVTTLNPVEIPTEIPATVVTPTKTLPIEIPIPTTISSEVTSLPPKIPTSLPPKNVSLPPKIPTSLPPKIVATTTEVETTTTEVEVVTSLPLKNVSLPPKNISLPPKNVATTTEIETTTTEVEVVTSLPPKNISLPPKNVATTTKVETTTTEVEVVTSLPPKNVSLPPKNISLPPKNVVTTTEVETTTTEVEVVTSLPLKNVSLPPKNISLPLKNVATTTEVETTITEVEVISSLPPKNVSLPPKNVATTTEVVATTTEVETETISTVTPTTSTKAPKTIPYTTTCSTEKKYATITTSLSGSPTDVPVYTVVPKLYESCVKYLGKCGKSQTFYDYVGEVASFAPVTCPDVELSQDIVAIADPNQENIYIPEK